MTPPGPNGECHCIIAVDVMSKWVELGALVDKSSHTITRWFHDNITCRFGTPRLVRCDQGNEFKGDFIRYLESIGCTHSPVFVAHPRANGLAERYVAVVKAGCRKYKSLSPNTTWVNHLGDIAAGLRMLPTRVGVSPYLIVFKQEPHWGVVSQGVNLAMTAVPGDDEME